MFSIITIESSTTKPVAIVSAIRVRLLILKPHRYITPKVPISDNGTAMLGMMVAGRLRRNKKITSTTNTIEISSSISTSRTEARMVRVRSVSVVTSIAAGNPEVSCGSNALTRSTVSIAFAPGWRCTFRIIAGLIFAHAAK